MTLTESGVGHEKRDFFISYSGEDEAWALWIASVLEQAGYSLIMQHLNFPPGSDWVHGMHRASMDSFITLAVLSRNYIRSAHGEAEWRIAYNADPSGELGVLIPVRVDDVKPPGLLATRVYIDIAGLDEKEARLQLLQGVRRAPYTGLPARKAINPSDAPFPAGSTLRADPPSMDMILAEYLRAVAAKYEGLPYVSLRSGVPLSAVYVPQYIEDISTGAPRGSYSSPALAIARTVDSVIDSDAHALIEGGPGSGKSSLLGHIATQLAQNGQHLPAVVRAGTLCAAEGSFSERLAKAVTHELGGRLIRPLPEDFFAAERMGKSWLILVDCLDEIVSARDRSRLVADLLHISAIVDAPYRIIIATRPVPVESQHDWSGFLRLRLLPMTDAQITFFAESWFGHTLGSDGIETAGEFVNEMKRRGITELLRTPLMLAMAASVFTRGKVNALPRNRAGIYEIFLDVMDDEESERLTRAAFRDSWDKRFGNYGRTIADEVFSSRRYILEHLAIALQEGLEITALQFTVDHVRHHWTGTGAMEIDSDWLTQQAAALLIRSAPISPAGADYQFIHETVREYLVAEGIARNISSERPEASETILRWKIESWRQPILFLLGIWSNRGDDMDALLRLISADHPDGIVFAASAIGDGTRASLAVRAETIRALGALIRTRPWAQILFSDPNPFRVMVSLGDSLCADELLAIALDDTVEVPVRAFSAEMLSEFAPSERAFEVLIALARESPEVMIRQGASAALARLGRLEIALPVLEEVISDPNAGLLLRSRAVDTLARHDATESLLRVATKPSLHPNLREIAAAHLESRRQGAQAARILSALIEDDRIDARLRERAVLALSRGGETASLREIADSEFVVGWIRVLAATHAAHAGDHDGAIARLRAIAWDIHQDERVRLRAVHVLCAFNDDDGVLSLASSADGLIQLAAAAGAPRKGNLTQLLSLVRRKAGDSQLPADVRHEAIDVLHRLGATREAAKFFLSMARSADVPAHVREEAVMSLYNGQHAAELLAICEDRTLPVWIRVSGCDAVIQLDAIRDVTGKQFFAELWMLTDGWLRDRLNNLRKGSRD